MLLNNDVEAVREGWLEEMLSRAAEPDVGAVGAKLTYPSGGVQHGGVVLGPNLAAAHAFDERQDRDPGYGELMRVAHETSAVTAACLLTPRRLFRAIGGFDGTRYPVLFNDVDYCLRLRAAGKRVVMTPHARLIHRAAASRGRDKPFDGRHRHQRDLDNLRMSWAEASGRGSVLQPDAGARLALRGARLAAALAGAADACYRAAEADPAGVLRGRGARRRRALRRRPSPRRSHKFRRPATSRRRRDKSVSRPQVLSPLR